MNASTLSLIGLVFDIVGVLLLFRFGLPPSVSRSGNFGLKLGHDPSEEAKGAFYDTMGRLGLGALVVCFALQVAGQIINA